MSTIWIWVKRHGELLAFLFLAMAFTLVIQQLHTTDQENLDRAQNAANQRLYEAELEACQRARKVLSVVYQNTADAVRQDPSAGFEAQLKKLNTIEHLKPGGSVNCSKAVPAL